MLIYKPASLASIKPGSTYRAMRLLCARPCPWALTENNNVWAKEEKPLLRSKTPKTSKKSDDR